MCTFARAIAAIVGGTVALAQAACVLQPPRVDGKVAITAHRGSSFMAPENTLTAIELAIAQGADYVEMDVRQTGDGTLVLLHDRSLRRVAGIARNIRDVDYGAIRDRELEIGYGAETVGERVPMLAEAIAAVRGRANLYIDLKYDTATPAMVSALAALLQREDAVEGTFVACTNRAVLDQVARLEPDLRLALFGHSGFGALEHRGLDAVALRQGQVTNGQVIAARLHGHELHAWTANRRATMARLIGKGVDNIITDRPDLLAEMLDPPAGGRGPW